jgi:hypothetical protein
MAKGRKTGGRKKGTPNKLTVLMKLAFERAVADRAKSLGELIDETRYGTIIEKTLADGSIVSGRLNADPKGAGDLMHKFAQFNLPTLARTAVTGPDGGPLEFTVRDLGKEG